MRFFCSRWDQNPHARCIRGAVCAWWGCFCRLRFSQKEEQKEPTGHTVTFWCIQNACMLQRAQSGRFEKKQGPIETTTAPCTPRLRRVRCAADACDSRQGNIRDVTRASTFRRRRTASCWTDSRHRDALERLRRDRRDSTTGTACVSFGRQDASGARRTSTCRASVSKNRALPEPIHLRRTIPFNIRLIFYKL